MRFEIHDVGYGSFAYLIANDGTLMVFDCCQDTERGFAPDEYLRGKGCMTVHRLFVSNYDEDHISGLPGIVASMGVSVLYSNVSISPDQLEAIKRDSGLSNAMQELLNLKRTYAPLVSPVASVPDVEHNVYWNNYPGFSDTNNLSMVTFLNAKSLRIVLPGDLAKKGWESLLGDASFRARLKQVNIFIASHHGREDGYCREVFDHCAPAVVMISDGAKQYATQEMVNTYGQHASGVQYNGQTRKVLTTRNDGSIWWDV